MRARAAIPILALLASCHRGAPPASAGAEMPAAQVDAQAAARTRDSLNYVRWSLPRLATAVLARPEVAREFEVFLGLNPYYQRGWFDGDSIVDVAVQVVQKATGKRGILIVHGADSSVHVLGAGSALRNGGDDFSWQGVWRVEPRSARPDIKPVGRELLYVEKPESAGGMIWWNGSEYVWTQYGD